jgi:hypothetical protein
LACNPLEDPSRCSRQKLIRLNSLACLSDSFQQPDERKLGITSPCDAQRPQTSIPFKFNNLVLGTRPSVIRIIGHHRLYKVAANAVKRAKDRAEKEGWEAPKAPNADIDRAPRDKNAPGEGSELLSALNKLIVSDLNSPQPFLMP